MPSLSVKDVPEPLAEKLRQRAARNHRSLQGELMAILEAAAHEPAEIASAAGPTAWRQRLAAQGIPVLRQGWRSAEDLIAESRHWTTTPSSVEAIREMRDTHYGEAWVMARVKDGHWPLQPGDSPPLGNELYCVIPKVSAA